MSWLLNAPAVSAGADDAVSTEVFLRKLAVEDPGRYKVVFKKFEEQTAAGHTKGGRGKKRQSFDPRKAASSSVLTATTERTKRKRLTGLERAMDKAKYIHHYTQVVPDGDKLDAVEAQLAWLRDINPANKLTEKAR